MLSILFAIVPDPDYGNEYTTVTKENTNWTSFKNYAPKLNLNHNVYITKAKLSSLSWITDIVKKIRTLWHSIQKEKQTESWPGYN